MNRAEQLNQKTRERRRRRQNRQQRWRRRHPKAHSLIRRGDGSIAYKVTHQRDMSDRKNHRRKER